MCFYIHTSLKHRKEKTATEDMVCYKTLCNPTNTQVMSLPRNFVYTVGKPYKIKKLRLTSSSPSPWPTEISEGFHSYSVKRKAKMKGYYAYECIIPKGSKYYYNPDRKEYVSDSIIILKYLPIIK